MTDCVYVGGLRSQVDLTMDDAGWTWVSLLKIVHDGSEYVWAKDLGSSRDVYSIAVDPAGNLLVGTSHLDDVAFYKLAPNGDVVWTKPHSSFHSWYGVFDVSFDLNGNAFMAGDRHDEQVEVTHRKYESDGTLVWEKDHGEFLYCLAVDNMGNSYFAGNVAADGKNLRKYDSNGDLAWEKGIGSTRIRGIAVDHEQQVHFGFYGNDAGVTHGILDANGERFVDMDHGEANEVTSVDCDPFLMYISIYGSPGDSHQKWTKEGELVWTKEHGCWINRIKVRVDGTVFIAGDYAWGGYEDNKSWRLLDKYGDPIWSGPPGTTNMNTKGAAVDPGLFGVGFWPDGVYVRSIPAKDVTYESATLRGAVYVQ